MRLDRFDLNLLVTLDALLETGNVTQAAQRLHIGQSGCSAALAKLRKHFDDELLAPDGRQLRLTPFAISLRETVRDALDRVRDLASTRATFDSAVSAYRFQIAASDYAITVLLAPLAAKLLIDAPNIILQMRSAPGDYISTRARGSHDFIIAPSRLELPMHERRPLFRDIVVGLVDAGHPTVQGSQISQAQLATLPHVAVQLSGEGAPVLPDWQFPELHDKLLTAAIVDRFHLAPLFVMNTDRIALLPRLLCQHLVERFPLKIMQLPRDLTTEITFDLAWPHHHHGAPHSRWMRSRILEEGALLNRRLPENDQC